MGVCTCTVCECDDRRSRPGGVRPGPHHLGHQTLPLLGEASHTELVPKKIDKDNLLPLSIFTKPK